MAQDSSEKLLLRINDLERELLRRDQDLKEYRTQVARLNERLENLISQIRQQLQLAQSIQRALVPTEIPTIPGFDFSTKYVASHIKGGDYFDIFEMDDRFRFTLLMSHSSGHGVSALFMSVILKLMSQAKARKAKDPEEVVRLLLSEVKLSIDPQEQASMFWGIINRKTFELLYVIAGEIMCFHKPASEKLFSQVPSTMPTISSASSPVVVVEKLALMPRDRIVLCSPGVILAKNSGGECFGLDRLKGVLSQTVEMRPHEARNEILFQMQKHISPADLSQDATVLVCEIKDRVLKLAPQ